MTTETNPANGAFPGAPPTSGGATENMNQSTRDAVDATTAPALVLDGANVPVVWNLTVATLGTPITRVVSSHAWRAARRSLRVSDIPTTLDAGGIAHEIASMPDAEIAVAVYGRELSRRLTLVAGAPFVLRIARTLQGVPPDAGTEGDARVNALAMLALHDTLTDFDSVERAFPPALAALDRIVPLHAAALVECDIDAARLSLFARNLDDASALLEADAAARVAWTELALQPLALDVSTANFQLAPAAQRPPPRVTGVREASRCPIHLPLVRGGRLSGMLRLDLEGPPSNDELALLVSFASALAVALAAPERASVVVEARTAAAEHAHRELLAVVSHDLRNPLSAILMSTSLLARAQKGPDARAENNKPVEVIKRSAERLNLLIQNVVDAAHLDSDGLTLVRDQHDAGNIVRDAVRMLEVQANNRQVKLTTDVPDDVGEMNCDRERLVQTIANVLHAVLRFTPKGGAVSVRAQRVDASRVHFEIQDSSPGFDSGDVLRMFDRRWWAERNHSLGTGLGLAVARGIVRAHGSDMTVASTQGVGNVFSFDIVGSQN